MSRPVPAILAVICVGALATAAYAASDQAFLKKALESDNAEIALSQMAEHKGVSQATKDLGQMLVNDHTAHRTKVLLLAKTHGVADTQAMGAGGRLEEVKLKLLDGPSFDREFARYMVHDHQKDITAFRDESHAADPAIADLAKQTLPTLHKHLDAAETLEHKTAA